eukprot:11205479-Lingulodinium_polyedra.AAC.1
MTRPFSIAAIAVRWQRVTVAGIGNLLCHPADLFLKLAGLVLTSGDMLIIIVALPGSAGGSLPTRRATTQPRLRLRWQAFLCGGQLVQ